MRAFRYDEEEIADILLVHGADESMFDVMVRLNVVDIFITI